MPARPTNEVRPARRHAGSVPVRSRVEEARWRRRLPRNPQVVRRTVDRVASRGRGAGRRWAVVAGGRRPGRAAARVGALPASDADVRRANCGPRPWPAPTLGFSGYAESAGGLALPVGDQLTSVADLFSDRTTMRVWWRGPADSRVDVVTRGGGDRRAPRPGRHLDLGVRDRDATRAAPARSPCPRRPTCCPARWAGGCSPRRPTRSCPGSAPSGSPAATPSGLRVTPADDGASVARVDVWVDADSGLPLQVQVSGTAAAGPRWTPGSSTSSSPPRAGRHRVRAAPGRRVREAQRGRVCSEAGGGSGPVALPAELAGLPRRRRRRAAGSACTAAGSPCSPSRRCRGGWQRGLRSALAAARRRRRRRWARGSPPARSALMVVERPGRGPYVLTGTVTLDALAAAAAELPDLGARRERRDHAPAGWSSGTAGCAPSTASTSTSGPATSTASSAPTARARRRRCGCCSAWCCRPAARSRCSGSGCRGPAGGCCRGSAR